MKRMLILALAAIACLSTMAQKRAVTIPDVYRITSVSAVGLSPNGKQLVYSVGNTSLQTLKSDRRIVVSNIDGTNAEEIITGESCYGPVWSADGRKIYYFDQAPDGMTQLFDYNLATREKRLLTHYKLGVADGIVSPDGRYVAFSAEVYPEFGADAERTIARRDSKNTGRVQAHIADSLFYRHWTEYGDGRVTHLMVCDLQTDEVRDLTPGTQTLLFTPSGDRLFAFSPDGRELCYVSNHDRHPEASTNADLWLVSVDGGQARNITAANKAWDGTPLYSPDGHYIAYRCQATPGYESDCFKLALYDRRDGTTRIVTPTFDDWVEDFAWSNDCSKIYFTADVRGYMPIYELTLATGKIVRQVPDVAASGAVTDSKGNFFFTNSTTGKPNALYRYEVKKHRTTQLTHYNDALEAEVDFRPSEELWIKGAAGDSMEIFIVKPHNFDPNKRYPLVMNVHGGPQMQWMNSFRADWQVYPGAGYVVAYPNPHGSTGRGQAYCAAISKDWGGKVFEDVMLAADTLSRLSYVDPDRMACMGWSYGGYMMNWLQGHTKRFKCLASMMGLYDTPSMWGTTEELWFPNYEFGGQPWNSELYEKWNPSASVKNFSTPTLILTGERDYRVSYTQSLQYYNALQTLGIPSRLIVFSNDGHWPSNMKSMPVYYNAHLEWFHRWLGGDPAPWDTEKMINNEVEY
ncbi:MAG: S9 family peptidase [Muribaculaceae bacterium]|nr:S9 family peptidase [Muribaculaceae bacterium]